MVAATLPPLRCRSHMISRRSSCGNICAIWATCSGVKRGLGLDRALGSGALLLADGFAVYHRTARKVTMTKTTIWGTLRVCSAMAE